MEICDVNRFYGHGQIIKDYCGYPNDEPIPFAIQHSANRAMRTLLHEHFEEPIFDYWVYSERVKSNAQSVFGIAENQLHILGSPFAYLVKQGMFTNVPPEFRSGTIVFPNHSAPGIEIAEDYIDYAEELSRLPRDFHPITVCIHPHDLRLKKHLAFLAKGFEVFICGDSSPLQNNFLHNYLHYCKGKKYVTSNILMTPCTYAMYLGIPFFITGLIPKQIITSQKEATYSYDEDYEHLKPFYDRYTIDALGDPEVEQDQRKFAEDDLGHKYLLPPNELLEYINQVRTTRKYIDKLKPFFDSVSKNMEQALVPSGPAKPLKAHPPYAYSVHPQTEVVKSISIEELFRADIEYREKVVQKSSISGLILACISSVNIPESIQALYRSTMHFEFEKVLFFTSENISSEQYAFFPELTVIPIKKISSLEGYSEFVMTLLNDHIESSHCMLVQNDGYILNHELWNNSFLSYDYIGAPWPPELSLRSKSGQTTGRINFAKNRVGNGGFSIRSKKLMEISSLLELSSLKFPTLSEDMLICHYLYEWFSQNGITFAPLELAAQFSCESPLPDFAIKPTQTLGFHGKAYMELARKIWEIRFNSL